MLRSNQTTRRSTETFTACSLPSFLPLYLAAFLAAPVLPFVVLPLFCLWFILILPWGLWLLLFACSLFQTSLHPVIIGCMRASLSILPAWGGALVFGLTRGYPRCFRCSCRSSQTGDNKLQASWERKK